MYSVSDIFLGAGLMGDIYTLLKLYKERGKAVLCPIHDPQGASFRQLDLPYDGQGFHQATKGLDIRQQIVAGLGIHFHGDRLGQIQTENTQNGFGVYHMAAGAKIDIVRILD